MSKKTEQEYFHSYCVSCNEPANINRRIFDCGKLQCPIQKHVCGRAIFVRSKEIADYLMGRQLDERKMLCTGLKKAD